MMEQEPIPKGDHEIVVRKGTRGKPCYHNLPLEDFGNADYKAKLNRMEFPGLLNQGFDPFILAHGTRAVP